MPKKIENKIQTIKQHRSGFISSQTRSGQAEKERKIFVPIRSYPSRARDIPKKSLKKFKNIILALFLAKSGRAG